MAGGLRFQTRVAINEALQVFPICYVRFGNDVSGVFVNYRVDEFHLIKHFIIQITYAQAYLHKNG